MTNLQKATVRASEIRSRLAELGGIEGELSDEQRSESAALATEYKDVETKIRNLTVAESDVNGEEVRTEDSEGRELRSLLSTANVGAIADATLSGRMTEGREAEIQKHFGLKGNYVPIEMLRRDAGEELETRAVTPAPTDAGRSQAPVLQPVFARSVLAFLAVPMPTVPVGDRVYPILGTRPTVSGPFTDSTAGTETTGTFTAQTLAPQRITARFSYRASDALRFAEMDSALRMALNDGLTEALDQQALAGTFGFFSADDGSSSPVLADNEVSAVDTFASLLSNLLYARVDGRFASDAMQIRQVMGSASYALAATKYDTNGAADNALVHLKREGGGIRVSPYVPAVASSKQWALVRLGNRRDAVCPIWRGVELIVDKVTRAAEGECRLVAHLFYNFRVIRVGGFRKQQTQHA